MNLKKQFLYNFLNVISCSNARLFGLRFFFYCVLILFINCKESEKKTTTHQFTNALVNETSPYLLQHAHNPVDWRPWGQEALADAKEENKLILISIGYSSCHWCHVMEEETFSDEAVARLMNEHFINIKVDREERPDVDDVYMTAVQLINGDGGWPLNVIALPDGKPLYGGTYHSKDNWLKVLSKINGLYQKNPNQAQEYANKLTKGIQDVNTIENNALKQNLDKTDLKAILAKSSKQWDTIWGGNLSQQKFMLPTSLDFLLDYSAIKKDSTVLKHLKITLDQIAIKGVYDHVDGGFFRYSTDKKWQMPHFEKMLYDNAQLISTYSKAYKIFKDPLYEETVTKTVNFLDKKLRSTSGVYFASLDAGKKEGAYYLWTEKELGLLIPENFELFKSYYAIESINQLEEAKYHLFKTERDTTFAGQNLISNKDFSTIKLNWNNRLIEARKGKELLDIDDKIIVSWNALMVLGLVDAYTAFGNEAYLQSAISTFETLINQAYLNDTLSHSYKPNSKKIEGFLDDYAYLQHAAIKLYAVTMDEKFLQLSQRLNIAVFDKFSDDKSDMFRYSTNDGLISKIVKTNDGVLPSANAVMANNLFLLGHLNYDKTSLEKSRLMLKTIMPQLKDYPDLYNYWNSLYLKTTLPFYEIAVVGKDAKMKLLKLNERHQPNAIVVGTTAPNHSPLFKNRFVEDETLIYVCKEKACKLPVRTAHDAIKQLDNF